MFAKTSLPAFKMYSFHECRAHIQILPLFTILLKYIRHLVKHTDISFVGFKAMLNNRDCPLPFFIRKKIKRQGNTDSTNDFICSPKYVSVLDKIIDYFVVKIFFQSAFESRYIMISKITICCVNKPFS